MRHPNLVFIFERQKILSAIMVRHNIFCAICMRYINLGAPYANKVIIVQYQFAFRFRFRFKRTLKNCNFNATPKF